MPPKRAPLVPSVQPARPSYGSPFQIYTEVVNSGKTVGVSKRRVRWRFGFSESEKEFEVEFVHSTFSGKKTIYENGKEIISAADVFATDFSYGWNSEFCAHIFRIEASLGVVSEASYIFAVDGVKFVDMPRGPIGGVKYRQRDSAQQATSAAINVRGNLVESKTSKDKRFAASSDFDPFASSTDDVSFGNPGSFVKQPSAHSPISRENKNKNVFASSTSGFDEFEPSQTVTTKVSKPAPVETTKDLLDGFDDSPRNAKLSFDLFDSTPAAPPATSSSSSFDLFSSDSFATSSSSNAAFDPFASSNTSFPSNAKVSSVAQDFIGLTLNSNATFSNTDGNFNSDPFASPPVPAVAVVDAVVTKPNSRSNTPTSDVTDPWGNDLVNLDLSGKPKIPIKPLYSSNSQPVGKPVPVMNPPPVPVMNPPPIPPMMNNPPVLNAGNFQGASGIGNGLMPLPGLPRPATLPNSMPVSVPVSMKPSQPLNPFDSFGSTGISHTPQVGLPGLRDPFASLPGLPAAKPSNDASGVNKLSNNFSGKPVNPFMNPPMSNNTAKSSVLNGNPNPPTTSLDTLKWN